MKLSEKEICILITALGYTQTRQPKLIFKSAGHKLEDYDKLEQRLIKKLYKSNT